FCASEIAPFVKTGGLADVAGALPLELEKSGVEVKMVMPKYKAVSSLQSPVSSLQSSVSSLKDDVDVTKIGKNIQVYLIKNDKYFNREGLYGDSHGDYPDNLQRFSFYCRRALELLKEINFKPDIIHCHDWQAGLIPVYLKSVYQKNGFYKHIKTLLTIHNLAYQGLFAKNEYPLLGLDWSLFNIEGLEFYGKINILKGAVVFSDLLNTVSPAYAREIQTEEFGCGLEGVLKKRHKNLSGILNGLDYEFWNPQKDGYIYKQYTAGNPRDKYYNKQMLAKELGLRLSEEVPLFGMVGRLTEQKGLGLIAESMEDLVKLGDIRIVILGVGDKRSRAILEDMAKKFPRSISAHIKFDESLAHKIYAASDVFLMPSRYEPCGLGQMIALAYGAIPLVYKTGGLADTVNRDNGFVFEHYSGKDLVRAVKDTLALYQDKKRWLFLARKAFSCNFSWEGSAGKYVKLYEKLAG
ncbi:glycogen synthase GlgA, partial [bacterium]